jgi:hypothetical protein
VTWNNNHAENAIKQFAYYREGRVGIMSEAGLKDYLVLLSLYQTCRYKGMEFLPFLLSGECDLEAFAASNGRNRRKAAVQVYPKGFTPPHFAAIRKRAERTTTGDMERCLPLSNPMIAKSPKSS